VSLDKRLTNARPGAARLSRLAVVLIGGILAGACATAGGPASNVSPATIAGCYWFDPEVGDAGLAMPWVVELTAEPLTGWPGLEDAFLAYTWSWPARRSDVPFGYWAWAAGDSIRAGYPGGNAGYDVRLAPVAGGLEGWGRAVGDAIEPGEVLPRPAHPVVARRVSCPAG